jgi:hypothetical protein
MVLPKWLPHGCLKSHGTRRRAHFGAADWLVALLVTLGVSEFLLLGPTASSQRSRSFFLGRWVGPSVADGKNHENMRDHGIKTRGWIRLPKLEIQIEMGIQIDLGCKITKKWDLVGYAGGINQLQGYKLQNIAISLTAKRWWLESLKPIRFGALGITSDELGSSRVLRTRWTRAVCLVSWCMHFGDRRMT